MILIIRPELGVSKSMLEFYLFYDTYGKVIGRERIGDRRMQWVRDRICKLDNDVDNASIQQSNNIP